MSYWLGMASVLLLGYGMIKWSRRADEQGDEGVTSSLDAGVLSGVGTRTLGTFTRPSTTDNGKNQGDRGGEA
jgi:hypothetical protein